MRLFAQQIRAARALLGWTQADLAKRAGIGEATVKRMEKEDGIVVGQFRKVIRVHEAIEKAGVQFIDPNGGGPGVRLRHPGG